MKCAVRQKLHDTKKFRQFLIGKNNRKKSKNQGKNKEKMKTKQNKINVKHLETV